MRDDFAHDLQTSRAEESVGPAVMRRPSLDQFDALLGPDADGNGDPEERGSRFAALSRCVEAPRPPGGHSLAWAQPCGTEARESLRRPYASR